MNKGSIVIIFGCVIACGVVATALVHRKPSPDDTTQETKRIASLVDQGHTKDLTGNDFSRMQSARPGEPVPHDDFVWMIKKLALNNQEPNSRVGIVTTTIPALLHAKLTSQQQKELQDVALPLLSMDDPVYNDGDIEEYACGVFVKYPDERANPRLKALVNSPHPWVKRESARALVALGEKVAIPDRPKTW